MKWLIVSIFLISKVFCDDGLCGLEPPKEGESCGGAASEGEEETEDYAIKIVFKEPEPFEEVRLNYTTKYEYVEKPLTPEEQDVWDRRHYPKVRLENYLKTFSKISVCKLFLIH